jgi:hypothetical protein
MSGTNCIDFCQYIIDCINNPESGVANAITGLIGASDYESARNYGQSQNNLDMSSGSNPTCNKDILFGQAMQLVNYIDQLNTDFFEILEVASNFYDFFAEVAGDVTGIDESSADAAIAWVQFIQDSIAENYAAQVTVAYREDLACEIFCAANDDCGITPTLLYDIMKDRLNSSITIEGLLWDVLSFLVDGSWSGSQIADFMFYSQFALRSMIGRYFDYFAWQDIYARLSIYSNDPNPDWIILCTDCGWESTLDLTVDDYGFIFDMDQNSVPVGSWVDGVGLIGEPVTIDGQARTQLSGGWDFDNSTVTSWRIQGTFTKGSVPGYAGGYVAINNRMELDDIVIATTQQTRTFNDFTVGVQTDIDISSSGFDETSNEFYMFYRSALNASNGATVIHTVTITGTGTKPSQLP